MFKIIYIYITVVLILVCIDFVLLGKHCQAGFGGYADEWDKPIYEKIHYILAPIILVLICGLFAMILVGKYLIK